MLLFTIDSIQLLPPNYQCGCVEELQVFVEILCGSHVCLQNILQSRKGALGVLLRICVPTEGYHVAHSMLPLHKSWYPSVGMCGENHCHDSPFTITRLP